MGDVEALAEQMCANLGGLWAFIRETRKDQYRRNARAALESDLFASLVAAARAEERERWAGEVRALADEFREMAGDHSERLSDFEDGYSVACADADRALAVLLPATESREDLRPREGA